MPMRVLGVVAPNDIGLPARLVSASPVLEQLPCQGLFMINLQRQALLVTVGARQAMPHNDNSMLADGYVP